MIRILKLCLFLTVLTVTTITCTELKYTDLNLRIYSSNPRLPSFNSDALKPLNFTLEGLSFISFDSDMLKILNFNNEPYVPIKAWMTIESTNNAINIYVEEKKGFVCYTFSKENREQLIKDIDKYISWSNQATQKKALVDKEIGEYFIDARFRNNDTWFPADEVFSVSGDIVPIMTTRIQSFEKEKQVFMFKPKSMKYKNYSVFTPTELFLFLEETKKFKLLLDQQKIDAVIRIHTDNKKAEDELK
ncbi:MAG: hypothetical protein A2Y40_05105 [Candidatus Margulisbacteria bacterium GWF2_35_9]|nr:MAG: hypothetical protein A2Y40_05105 [Candidatus Margulisbacteria bacterium GWF2_35_9]